jgi:hypothetical protein
VDIKTDGDICSSLKALRCGSASSHMYCDVFCLDRYVDIHPHLHCSCSSRSSTQAGDVTILLSRTHSFPLE